MDGKFIGALSAAWVAARRQGEEEEASFDLSPLFFLSQIGLQFFYPAAAAVSSRG